MNLVGNGLKYADNVSVSLTANQLVISDDGPGIPEAERARVFQPFYRLEGSRNVSTGGSGGLAVVQQLCAAHGWQVEISDSAKGGASLLGVLPAVIDVAPVRKGQPKTGPKSLT